MTSALLVSGTAAVSGFVRLQPRSRPMPPAIPDTKPRRVGKVVIIKFPLFILDYTCQRCKNMNRRYWSWAISVGLMLAMAIVAGRAQQPVATKGKAGKAPTAPPGINWPSPPLPDGPIVLD